MFTNTASDLVEKAGICRPATTRQRASPSPADGSGSKAPGGTATTKKAKSAAADIANPQIAAKPDPVGDAIKKCKAVAQGQSVFKAANARVFEGLTAAYSIFLLIKDDKVEHQRVIDELMAEGDRERMPSLNKPAYNATVLACHPDNPESWTPGVRTFLQDGRVRDPVCVSRGIRAAPAA